MAAGDTILTGTPSRLMLECSRWSTLATAPPDREPIRADAASADARIALRDALDGLAI